MRDSAYLLRWIAVVKLLSGVVFVLRFARALVLVSLLR